MFLLLFELGRAIFWASFDGIDGEGNVMGFSFRVLASNNFTGKLPDEIGDLINLPDL